MYLRDEFGSSRSYPDRAPDGNPFGAISSRYRSRFPTMPSTIAPRWSMVSSSRTFWRPSNSSTYRCRCFDDVLWKVPMWVRLSIDQKDSAPFVCAMPRTYCETLCLCETKERSCRPSRWGLDHPSVARRRRGDERTGGARADPGLVARGGTRPCPLVERVRTDRRSSRRARQQHGVRRRRLRRAHPDLICVVLLPWATAPGSGARVLRCLLPPGRTGPAPAAFPRRRAVPHHRSLHRGGIENLRGIQRATGPRSRPEQHQRAPGRVQRLAHRLGRQRPSRRGWLVVRPARLDPASPAPYPSVWPTPCSRRCATRRFGEPAWHARNAKRFGYGCSRSARWSPEMPAPSRSGSPAPAPTKPCSDCSYAGSPPDNPGPRRNDPENDPQSDLGAPHLASRRRRGSKASHTTVSTAPSRPAGPSTPERPLENSPKKPTTRQQTKSRPSCNMRVKLAAYIVRTTKLASQPNCPANSESSSLAREPKGAKRFGNRNPES